MTNIEETETEDPIITAMLHGTLCDLIWNFAVTLDLRLHAMWVC